MDLGTEFDAIAAMSATKLDASAVANPTGTVGLATVNGVASTYMRSDAAPPLSQAIVPTWTGVHTFSAVPVFNAGLTSNAKGSFTAATDAIDVNINSGSFSATGSPALRVINGNASAQSPVDFFSNTSTLTGRIRNDYTGNMAYVSLLSGTHGFFVGGDAGVGTNTFNVVSAANGGSTTIDQGGTLQVVGFRDMPVNAQSASYTLALSDRGKTVLQQAASTTVTIPANASVAFPVGTVISVISSGGAITLAITTDTLVFAGSGATGSRTLAGNGVATLIKITATIWYVTGVGLS